MPASISISIALCTCNGERFLEEQLASLASQYHLPTELVVCDDASDDRTYELLEKFSGRAPFTVNLHRNTQRLGIQFVQGADWVCCNARLTDTALAFNIDTLWDIVRFGDDERDRAANGHFFEVLSKHYVVAGAAIAFRAELRDQLFPIPPDWLYDAWLAIVLAATKKVALMDECLQLYRQHDKNAIGAQRRGFFENMRNALGVSRAEYLNLEILRGLNWLHA